MANCSNCGRRHDNMVVNQDTGRDVCPSCASIMLFQSDIDGCYYPRSQRVMHEGQWMTELQKDQYDQVCCDRCSSWVDNDETYGVRYYHRSERGSDYDDQVWCSECYHSHTFTCERCDDAVDEVISVETEGECTEEWCPTCAADYGTECQDCGTVVCDDNEDQVDNDGYRYCRDHMPERTPEPDNVDIHHYSFSPSLEFHHVLSCDSGGKYHRNGATHYGIELEVVTPNGAAHTADECSLLHDSSKFYLKRDSSITGDYDDDGGFEIVTHPMTYAAHKETGWRDILKELKDNDAYSYDDNTCGIHIHISRKNFSNFHWWKVLEFIWTCKSYVKQFAQRNGNYQYCSYYSPENCGGWSNMKSAAPHQYSRTSHINFHNSKTVEFRLFRGTTDIKRFWASMQFVHSLMDFCKNHGWAFIKRSDTDALWTEYIRFIRSKNQFQPLLKHFSHRNLNRL